MLRDTEFTIVDLETTGLCPGAHNRIIEIAMIRMDAGGHVLREYASLINPDRDLGAAFIHGISARDLREAPQFPDVAGDVLQMLRGAIFVAHNASFDYRFLRAELSRIGHTLPDCPRLCTMQLSRIAAPEVRSRRLCDLCDEFGIPFSHGHAAYEDAKATFSLFVKCLDLVGNTEDIVPEDICIHVPSQHQEPWPEIPASGKSYVRSVASAQQESHHTYLDHLISRLPNCVAMDAEFDSYLELLDRVLEDRRLEEAESEELFATAEALGMSAEQVKKTHLAYIEGLICLALEDGVISESELTDFQEVARMLCVPQERLEPMLSIADEGRSRPASAGSRQGRDRLKGKSICFTGTFNCTVRGERASRDMARSIAAEHGLEIHGAVTKKLDILVLADPDSMSRKAKKARQHGIRMIAEPVFWQMMGIQVG